MQQPIQIPNKLFSNPKRKPQFSTEITYQKSDGSQQNLICGDPEATRALVALMDMYAVLGGAACHYGGPAAMAELLSSLHALMFAKAEKEGKQWHELFHFVNDAGHCENGLYALRANYGAGSLTLESLKKFRSIDSGLTGHGESHLYPEGVLISNGPLGSAFPQSQGLAMGEKLSGQMRTTVTMISDGACMEGEAKEAFSAIPGLAARGFLAPYVLIISDNNTKLSGRIDQESFSLQPTFASLTQLGWKVLKLEKGNDLRACAEILSQALEFSQSNPQQPVVIHAKTVKGIGTKKTADSASGGHGFPLKSPSELSAFLQEIYNGKKYPEVFEAWIEELMQIEAKIKASGIKDSGEKIQKGIAQALIEAKDKGLPILSITSDLPGSTGVADFRKKFPEASFDVGVAESNMISTAAGLSKLGYIPVVDTFAQFGVTKGALPLTMASLSQAPVICIFSHTGFQDAADGASHQALSYLAMVSSIPHVKVYNLSCSKEANEILSAVIKDFSEKRKQGKTPETAVLFLGRENFPSQYLKNGKDPVIFSSSAPTLLATSEETQDKTWTLLTTGSSTYEGVKATEKLRQKGKNHLQHFHFSNVSGSDLTEVMQAISYSQGRVLFVEDHQKLCGFAQIVTHQILEQASKQKTSLKLYVKTLAVQGEFGQSAYTAQQLYSKHHIDTESIINAT